MIGRVQMDRRGIFNNKKKHTNTSGYKFLILE